MKEPKYDEERRAQEEQNRCDSFNQHVHIDVIDPDFRPQSVTADNIEFRDIAAVDIWQRQDISIPLLYDPGSGLPERIISEQFAP